MYIHYIINFVHITCTYMYLSLHVHVYMHVQVHVVTTACTYTYLSTSTFENARYLRMSFCLSYRPSPLHFTPEHLMSTGRELCEVLLKLCHYHKSNRYNYITQA